MPVRTLTHGGLTLKISEWAARTHQSPQTLRNRLSSGWAIADALNTPTSKCGTTPFLEAVSIERERSERKLKTNAKQVRREFDKLVADMNRALNVFNYRLAAIMDDDDRGVVSDHDKNTSDRLPRVAEECA